MIKFSKIWIKNSLEVSKIAESEATLWEKAHVDDLSLQHQQLAPTPTLLGYTCLRCFVDDYDKETDIFSDLVWFCFQDDAERSVM